MQINTFDNSHLELPKVFIGYDSELLEKELIRKFIWLSSCPHTLIVGQSGSGKTVLTKLLIGQLIKAKKPLNIYIGDYKRQDFEYIENPTKVFFHKDVIQLINLMEEEINLRIAEKAFRTEPVIYLLDEYPSFVLSLEKKQADYVKKVISSILMQGRSLNIYLLVVCQRADAELFPLGSRNNYHNTVLLGTRPSAETLRMVGTEAPVSPKANGRIITEHYNCDITIPRVDIMRLDILIAQYFKDEMQRQTEPAL